MINLTRKEMSAILKEMALTMLVNPHAIPSTEAAAAALLLSHIAWNRANGVAIAESDCEAALAEIQGERPDLWREFRSPDASRLISDLLVYKRCHYPRDNRRITACILHPDKVRVEWTE